MGIFEEFKSITERHLPILYQIVKKGQVYKPKNKKRVLPLPTLKLPHEVTVICNEKDRICVVLTHFEKSRFLGLELYKLPEEDDLYLIIMIKMESVICPIEDFQKPLRVAISGGKQMAFSMENGEDVSLSEKATMQDDRIFDGNIINQIVRMLRYE